MKNINIFDFQEIFILKGHLKFPSNIIFKKIRKTKTPVEFKPIEKTNEKKKSVDLRRSG